MKFSISYCFPQRLRNIRFGLFLLCMGIMIQSMMVSGALNISISRIEKAFHYNSFQVAFIDTTYNISFAIFALLLGYFVTSHKMRFIGIGTLLISLGCLMFILPVFINKDITEIHSESSILCNATTNATQKACKEGNVNYLIFLCLSYFIIGMGACSYHTLAINYINDHATYVDVGLCTGIYYACAAFGPVISFAIYSVVVKLPIRLTSSSDLLTTSDSENWIGAYWLVYAIGTVLALSISLPMMCFPSNISSSGLSMLTKSQASIKKFKRTMRSIFTNGPFVLVSLGMFFDGIMNNGIGVFLAKYIESQFRVSTAMAALYSGALIVLGASGGVLVGGMCINRFKWTGKILIYRISYFSIVGVFGLCFLFIRCPNMELLGVQYSGNNRLEFSDSCSVACSCDISQYIPVCVNNNETYYSPCALGCITQTGIKGALNFSQCGCYKNQTPNMSVEEGSCKSSCNMIYLFLPLGLCFIFFEFLIYTPEISFSLAVLDDESRQFGISCQQIFVRFSYIIGPLIFGPLMDSSCKYFNSASCTLMSNCIHYDLKKLSTSIALFSLACKIIATAFLFLSARFTKESTISRVQSVS